jgi:hypothetical protein
MSLTPCDECRKRVPEKLAQCTWAWYRADGVRVAWRKRLCTACFCSLVLPLDKDLDYANGLTCPACGISTEDDMDPVYVTSYLPGQGKTQVEAPTCASCAAIIRTRAIEHATQLEDKRVEGPSATGPSTLTTRESYWAALGIAPKADRA